MSKYMYILLNNAYLLSQFIFIVYIFVVLKIIIGNLRTMNCSTCYCNYFILTTRARPFDLEEKDSYSLNLIKEFILLF